MDWKDSFNPRTLSAGWRLYQQHGVDQILRDHHIYFAHVGDAWIEAQIEDGQIVTISCTCPQAQAGMLCPHEAAFLFALEDYPDLSSIPMAQTDRTADDEQEPWNTESLQNAAFEEAPKEPALDQPPRTPMESLWEAPSQKVNESQKEEKSDESERAGSESDTTPEEAALLREPGLEEPHQKSMPEVLETDEDIHDYMETEPAQEPVQTETVHPSSEKAPHSEVLEADEDVHDYMDTESPKEAVREETVSPEIPHGPVSEIFRTDQDIHDYIEEDGTPSEDEPDSLLENQSVLKESEPAKSPALQEKFALAGPEKNSSSSQAANEKASAAETGPAWPDRTDESAVLPAQSEKTDSSEFHFTEMTLEEILKSLTESELRSLLLRLCRQSEDNENIVLAFAPEHLQNEALDLLRQKLENQLAGILSCRHLSRRQAPAVLDSFIRSIQLTADQLEKNESGKGVALLLDLAETAEENMASVQLGLLETFLEEDFRMVRTWVSSLNRENLTSLFSWAELHLEQNDLPHLRKELEDLLEKSNFNTAELAERKLQIMNGLLETEKQNGRERGARTRHLYEVILNLYEEFPALLEDTDAWKSYKENYGQTQGFRILEAERAMKDHRTREGEDLLYSLNSEKMTMNEENHFNHLLLESFRLENNSHEMRRLLKHMVTLRGMVSAEDLVLLKELESPEEFEEDFNSAIQNARKKELFSFCTSQKLYDRLLDLLEKEPSCHDLSQLNLPEQEVDAKRLGNLWLAAAEKELEGASEMESYIQAVGALNQAARLGLKEEAAAAAENWKKKYPHRLSLLSQLRSAGYR